jgi:hypothetical protein
MIATWTMGKVSTARNVHQLLQWIEEAYDVSITFWLQIGEDAGGMSGDYVYCTFSGDLADLLDNRLQVAKSRIVANSFGEIYTPLWSCLTELESRLAQVGVAKIAPPPL